MDWKRRSRWPWTAAAAGLLFAVLPPGAAATDAEELVVWTINTHRCGDTRREACPGDKYPWRLRGIAHRLRAAYPAQIGLIGLQEVKAEMTACKYPPAKTNGAKCLARELSAIYNQPAEGRYTIHNQVGLVIGGDWREVGKRTYWELSTRRYLMEAVVEHRTLGYQLRFYSTHFSNTSADKRLEAARKVTSLIRTRARPGELPPILVGDFNASRDLGSNRAEASVVKLEENFWRPIDKVYPTGRLGVDLIYLGKKARFPASVGDYQPVKHLSVRLTDSPVDIPGYPNFPYRLSDHNAEGFVLNIVGGKPYPKPSTGRQRELERPLPPGAHQP